MTDLTSSASRLSINAETYNSPDTKEESQFKKKQTCIVDIQTDPHQGPFRTETATTDAEPSQAESPPPAPAEPVVHPPPRYKCDICGQIFHNRHCITAHLRQHCGLKPFACPTCNASFTKWNAYQTHCRKHPNTDHLPAVHRCEVDGCTKFYDLAQSLKVHHDRVHLGLRRRAPPNTSYMCETCGKSFKTKWFLRDHSYTHQSVDQWPYGCAHCPKRFISKYKCNVHMMRHNNVKNFACPMCERRTCTKKEMETHIGYHNKELSFPCALCESLFRSKVALQRHTRIVHQRYKPYVCTFCDMTFGKRDTLRHHTMRHTGERPHACALCDRRFIQVVALRAHMKTHKKRHSLEANP